MTSEIVSLRNENAVLREELALANQQLEWFRKQIFGRKTEQTSDELVFTLPKYHIRRHIVHKYKCPECGEKPSTPRIS